MSVAVSWQSKPIELTNDCYKPPKWTASLSSSNKSPARTRTRTTKHKCRICCSLGPPIFQHHLSSSSTTLSTDPFQGIAKISSSHSALLMDLDPATAKLAIGFLGPFLSAFGFLFILRIVMSWYPKLPVDKFPYVIAYAPTEPLLVQTRKLIPPLGGVDVTPVVWFGLISFLNEILVGPQGLLVLLSQQV